MMIKVRVVPNSKTESVQQTGETSYRLKIREKAIEGRANIAVVAALAEHFKVGRADVSIMHGAKSRDKVVEVATSTTSDKDAGSAES